MNEVSFGMMSPLYRKANKSLLSVVVGLLLLKRNIPSGFLRCYLVISTRDGMCLLMNCTPIILIYKKLSSISPTSAIEKTGPSTQINLSPRLQRPHLPIPQCIRASRVT